MLTEKHFLACPLGVKRAWSVPAVGKMCAQSAERARDLKGLNSVF